MTRHPRKGIAVRIGSSISFNVEATKVIHGILIFSPAPYSMEVEFLNELEKVSGMEYLVTRVACRTCQSDPTTWATEIMNFLSTNFQMEARTSELKPVANRASEMLSYLIATRNPGGEKTSQGSVHSTLNVTQLCQIKDLLNEATTNISQSALKGLLVLFLRDGFRCPFTDHPFAPHGGYVIARATHILPFSFHNKWRQLAEEVKENINHPCNAFNAERNAHEAYDKLAWGIEAIQVGNEVNKIFLIEGSEVKYLAAEWKYFFREVRPNGISVTIRLTEGQEIIFGRGDPGGQTLAKPNLEYCNLKLAVARVMSACGAAYIIAKMYGDDDDDEAIITQPVYMGGPLMFFSADSMIGC